MLRLDSHYILLPSERAKAYKMKLEAIKRQGARRDLTSRQVGKVSGVSPGTPAPASASVKEPLAVDRVASDVGRQKIAMTPAVEISYLSPEEQALLVEPIESEQATPSLSRAQRMKKLSQSGGLNEDTMLAIMSEEKKPEVDKIVFTSDTLRKYFPRSYTSRRMENTIIKLLEAWQKRRQRNQER